MVIADAILHPGTYRAGDFVFVLLPLTAPFLVILWTSRTNPPGRAGLALAISMGIAIALISAAVVTWPPESGREFGLEAAWLLGLIAYLILPIRISFLLPAGAHGLKPALAGISLALLWIIVLGPYLIRSWGGSNDVSSVSAIRAINDGETTYASTYPEIGFASLASLGGAGGSPQSAGLLDSVLACPAQPCVKSGYRFNVTVGPGKPAKTYSATAEPVQVGKTGERAFCTDQTGLIKFSSDGQASTCLASGIPLQ